MKKISFFILEQLHYFYSLRHDVRLKQFQVGQTLITVGHCPMTDAYFQPCCLSCPGIKIFSGNTEDSNSGCYAEESDTEETYNEITKFEQELELNVLLILILPILLLLFFCSSALFLQIIYLFQLFSIETISEMMLDQHNHVKADFHQAK